MWYKFLNNEKIGRLAVKLTQICWYDLERNGDCFDEDLIYPSVYDSETLKSIGKHLPYARIINDSGSSRVFIHMENGDVYELLMKKLSKEQFEECSNFNGGRGV